MATFDWNDVELTNIIWDETRESDDHIVPYPDRNDEKRLVLFGDLTNKETNIETSYVSHIEQKKLPISSEHQVELVDSSKYEILGHSPGFGLVSWSDGSDMPVIKVAESNQDTMGATEFDNITKSIKGGFSTDDTPEFDKGSEYFQIPSKDSEKSDCVDYEWANIESFDDLDRIFNNGNPIFGDVNVGYVDELWSSCKDGNSCLSNLSHASSDASKLPLGALRSSSDTSDDKAQYTLDLQESCLSVCEKRHGTKSQSHDVRTFEIDEKSQVLHKQLDDGNAAIVNVFPVKGNEQKRFLKDQKSKETSKRQMHDLCAARPTYQSASEQVNDQYAQSVFTSCPPLVLSQQRQQVQRTETFPQKKFSGPLLASPFHGNIVYHYPNAPLLSSKFQPIEGNRKLGGANPVKKSVDAATNPPAMTPKEKIEKLRRRQQLRAILAIQKQQQQFGNPVLVENSTVGGNIEVDENIISCPSLDRNSAIEDDDNNTMPFSICSVEESVLRRLQDTISRLDMEIRLCIRDSLFRLAKSAIQRQCPSDTSSDNTSTRDEINKDIDIHEGITRIPDVETDSNPIDRIVAQLLFHTPAEFSGKLSETPESPVSAKPFCERKLNSSKSSANEYYPESFENPQMKFPHSSKILCTYVEKSGPKNISCLHAVKNASKDGATTAVAMMNAEASKS